jgi:UDP-glucuronate decarboxylase
VVAGGAGFLGSHLCEALLRRGHRVICIDSFLTGSSRNLAALAREPRFELIEQDICTPVRIAGPVNRIYNLACPASPPRYQADPEHTMLTSVVGTGRLLRLAELHGARFLQASTSEVYGDPERHPQAEDYLGRVNCTGPRACYDEGKRAAEALCFDYRRVGRAEVRVARIFNTYGPRMRPDDGRIVSNLVVQALNGQPMTIFGTGEQTRSFCYVEDMVRGLVALMECPRDPGGPVNLGNPREFTVNELARMVAELAGVRLALRHLPLPQDDPQRRRPDIERARRLLGWEPEVPLRAGLGETIAWFRVAGTLPEGVVRGVSASRLSAAAAGE